MPHSYAPARSMSGAGSLATASMALLYSSMACCHLPSSAIMRASKVYQPMGPMSVVAVSKRPSRGEVCRHYGGHVRGIGRSFVAG